MKKSFQMMRPVNIATVPGHGPEQREDDPEVDAEERAVDPRRFLVLRGSARTNPV